MEKNGKWIEKSPITLDRLSLVFVTEGGKGWTFSRGGQGGAIPAIIWLWNEIGLALSGNAKVLEVVGMELIDKVWAEMDLKGMIEKTREAMRRVLLDQGWDEATIVKRVEGVRFLKRREFDARKT